MKPVYLNVEHAVYTALQAHLFPPLDPAEQGAFLFLKDSSDGTRTTFNVVDVRMLGTSDFIRQESHGVELTDDALAGVIKHAHDIGAAPAEVHSHRSSWRARFSCTDISELRDTVPYMWWRLQQPYIALVFTARSGFDALVWLDGPATPCTPNALVVGTRQIIPTGLSLGDWRCRDSLTDTIETSVSSEKKDSTNSSERR